LARILAFLACCLVGLYPAYKTYEFANKSCGIIATGSAQQVTPEKSGDKQNAAAKPEMQASNHTQAQANRANNKQADLNSDWGREFWCKATVTDFAIAYFTYCLVIVGVFGMWSAEKMTRDSERAHMFPDMKPYLSQNNAIQITITPTNNGRSAGILREVCGDFAVKKTMGPITLSRDRHEFRPSGQSRPRFRGIRGIPISDCWKPVFLRLHRLSGFV
jgi:hypothetical protein